MSPELEAVVMRGLERDLSKRWKTTSEFADAFCQAVGRHEGKAKTGFLGGFFKRK